MNMKNKASAYDEAAALFTVPCLAGLPKLLCLLRNCYLPTSFSTDENACEPLNTIRRRFSSSETFMNLPWLMLSFAGTEAAHLRKR